MIQNNKSQSSTRYALSIFMKFGEVLHLEGLDRELKDKYFDLARTPNASMLVEDRNSIRNIKGSDIANITAKKYDIAYERTIFQVKKMLLSQSSVNKSIYFIAMKIFAFLAFIAVGSQLMVSLASGEIMDLVMDMNKMGALLGKGVSSAMNVFKYTVIIMYLIAVVDIILGLNADYYINQDGVEPVDNRRIDGVLITTVFTFVVILIKGFI